MKVEVAGKPRETVRDIVSKYVKERPERITLRLFWDEDRSLIILRGEGLDETVECSGTVPFTPFAHGVVDAYRDAYGDLKVVPVSFREEIYENERVSLLLYPTGSAGIFDIYVKYREGEAVEG